MSYFLLCAVNDAVEWLAERDESATETCREGGGGGEEERAGSISPEGELKLMLIRERELL